ncbi:MAG: hypothetical protein KGJ41_18705 [Rhodospirillales bacterium]|nr:hypothetical protein [Rhodospirillales bacterium]MDE2201041.1 hypothetical protein [Rhodospirillales bacterium]MDE2573756.1 hypothetical protein [Rhodospirillales bacterium]
MTRCLTSRRKTPRPERRTQIPPPTVAAADRPGAPADHHGAGSVAAGSPLTALVRALARQAAREQWRLQVVVADDSTAASPHGTDDV